VVIAAAAARTRPAARVEKPQQRRAEAGPHS
jgi:hypothetical protein